MADEKKIGVLALWKNNDEYYDLTPEKRAELSEEWNEIKKRWKEKSQAGGELPRRRNGQV